MLLKDISVGTVPNSIYGTRLNWEAHCIVDLYLRNLMPYNNDFIKKLNIFLIGKDEVDKVLSMGMPINKFGTNGLSIGEIFLHFDFEAYSNADEYGKKLMILDKIQEGFDLFSRETRTTLSIFKKVYQKCIEVKLDNELVLKENLISRNGKYSATIKLRVDLEKLQIIAVVKNLKDGTRTENTFHSEKPAALFSHRLGSIKWTEHNELALFDKTGQHKWTLAFSET